MDQQIYAIWFEGNEEYPPTICYDGRSMFFSSDLEVVKSYKNVLQETAGIDKFKLVKIKEVIEE